MSNPDPVGRPGQGGALRRTVVATGVIGLVLSFTGLTCAAPNTSESPEQSPQAEAPELGPDTIDILLDDYVFGMPDTLPSGEITLRIANVGIEEHDLVFTQSIGGVPAWRLPSRLGSGDESIYTLALEPGTYQVVCDFAGHIGRGMVSAVHVVDVGG